MREVLRWQYEEVLLCLTFCARAAAQLAAGAGEAAGDAAEQVLPSPPGAEQSQLPPRDVVGRLVQRVLSSVQTLHLNELSDRKRADSICARLAITQHCQLEKDYVADFLARDLQQFGSNLTAKLLAECEIHLARERREFLEEVDACVEQKVLAYRHEVCADEQQTVLEQRKKLQERLVVLERQGLLRPETKQQYERLRREHRACNVRLELLGAALEGLEWEHDEDSADALVPEGYSAAVPMDVPPPPPQLSVGPPPPPPPGGFVEEAGSSMRDSPSLLENTAPGHEAKGGSRGRPPMPEAPAHGRALREKFSVTASEMPLAADGELPAYPPPRPMRPEGPAPGRGRSLPHFGSTDSLARQESP